jgi:hypothetical protein
MAKYQTIVGARRQPVNAKNALSKLVLAAKETLGVVIGGADGGSFHKDKRDVCTTVRFDPRLPPPSRGLLEGFKAWRAAMEAGGVSAEPP